MRYLFVLLFAVIFVSNACVEKTVDEPVLEETNTNENSGLEYGSDKHEPILDSGAPELGAELTDRPEWNAALCLKAREDWSEFRKKAQVCEKNDDCVVVGYRGGCECSYGIAGLGGLPINIKYASEANSIEGRYFRYCEQAKRCLYDGLKSWRGPCVNGKCTTSPNSPGCW